MGFAQSPDEGELPSDGIGSDNSTPFVRGRANEGPSKGGLTKEDTVADAIAVLNAGSSSIKFSLFVARRAELELELHGQVESVYTTPHFTAKRRDGTSAGEKFWAEGSKLGHDGALDHLLAFLRSELADDHLIGVGHRVLHGGLDYKGPVRIDAGVAVALEKVVPLAPLHQPHNLAPIRRLLDRVPDLPQVACFDTSFHSTNHSTNPDLARRFALPRSWRTALRIPRSIV